MAISSNVTSVYKHLPWSAPRNVHLGSTVGCTGFTSIWREALFTGNSSKHHQLLAPPITANTTLTNITTNQLHVHF